MSNKPIELALNELSGVQLSESQASSPLHSEWLQSLEERTSHSRYGDILKQGVVAEILVGGAMSMGMILKGSETVAEGFTFLPELKAIESFAMAHPRIFLASFAVLGGIAAVTGYRMYREYQKEKMQFAEK